MKKVFRNRGLVDRTGSGGGGSFIMNACEKFEATPTFALTTPIYDRRRRVLSLLSRLTAGSRPEMAPFSTRTFTKVC